MYDIHALTTHKTTQEEFAKWLPPQPPILIDTNPKFLWMSIRRHLERITWIACGCSILYNIVLSLLHPLFPHNLPWIPKKTIQWVITPSFLYCSLVQLIPIWMHISSYSFRILFCHNYLSKYRQDIPRQLDAYFLSMQEPKILKRCSIQVNGSLIDTLIVNSNTQLTRRVMVLSLDSNQVYEKFPREWATLAHNLNATLLLYNYPGAGSSQGLPLWPAVSGDVHKAVLRCAIEVLGAKQIIDFGYGYVGVGVQAESMDRFPSMENIKYIRVKMQGIANSSLYIRHTIWLGFFFSGFVALSGWGGYASDQLSKTTKHKEIIIHQTKKRPNVPIWEIQNIRELDDIDDGISNKASLATHLFGKTPRTTQFFLKSGNENNDTLFLNSLTRIINTYLQPPPAFHE